MTTEELLLTAIHASIAASEEILDVYEKEDFQAELKSDNSPLTIADKRAHNKIVEYLEKTDIPILSEEGKSIDYETRKQWNPFWLVDPLDGTKEFIKRNGEFTVNIALIENNQPVMGVIFVPVKDTLYFASGEYGSFMIQEYSKKNFESLSNLISASTKLPLPKNNDIYKVVASRSHLNEDTQAFIDELKTKHQKIEIISSGSSLKICEVASGNADIYPRFGPTMEWDTAAGHAIAAFSGAEVYKTDETPLLYNKENLLNPYFIVKR
jgi:3'(2'), 5'-bisphosphate nucleotidase